MNLFDVYPLFQLEPVAAQGAWITDANGQQYLDLYGGHAVISIGHSHPHYQKRIEEQLHRMAFYSNAVQMPLQEQLAETLGKVSGYQDYALFLCNSGAEANENALKLASFRNGRRKIIAFEGAFHGRTSLAVATTDDPAIRALVNAHEHIVHLPLNDYEAFSNALDEEVSSVIIEGIQGVGGIVLPDDDFLQFIRRECDRVGAFLILDEVQSGYGRTGKFFAHQYAGVRPDLITVAKGMGNGFPIAGVLIHPDFKPRKSMLGTTFGGNYLACAAALAVLEVIQAENLMQQSAELGHIWKEKLAEIPGVREVRGRGLMLGLVLNQPIAPIRQQLLYVHRIYTGSSSDPKTLRLLPPLNLKASEAMQFVDALTTCLSSKQLVS